MKISKLTKKKKMRLLDVFFKKWTNNEKMAYLKASDFAIYSVLGRKVFESRIDINNNTIDVSKLSGIYLVNIITKEKTFTKKIVINL